MVAHPLWVAEVFLDPLRGGVLIVLGTEVLAFS
jgi:hypothetical protein